MLGWWDSALISSFHCFLLNGGVRLRGFHHLQPGKRSNHTAKFKHPLSYDTAFILPAEYTHTNTPPSALQGFMLSIVHWILRILSLIFGRETLFWEVVVCFSHDLRYFSYCKKDLNSKSFAYEGDNILILEDRFLLYCKDILTWEI